MSQKLCRAGPTLNVKAGNISKWNKHLERPFWRPTVWPEIFSILNLNQNCIEDDPVKFGAFGDDTPETELSCALLGVWHKQWGTSGGRGSWPVSPVIKYPTLLHSALPRYCCCTTYSPNIVLGSTSLPWMVNCTGGAGCRRLPSLYTAPTTLYTAPTHPPCKLLSLDGQSPRYRHHEAPYCCSDLPIFTTPVNLP